ncbi:hypothetical protein M758_3G038400 [Ceratodon purpureus]|nr:hypothetical protein M758_3G038400 [Ceratodon purpureus]
MKPIGVLPRWLVGLRLTDVTIMVLSILLINYWGLTEDGFGIFNMIRFGILYPLCGIAPLIFTLAFRAEQNFLTNMSESYRISSMLIFSILVEMFVRDLPNYHSKDGCDEGCYSVIQACFWPIPADDPLRSGDIDLMVGNRRLRVHLGLFGGLFSVLIRCGRVVGGVDGLVAWRLGLGSMGAMILTFVLGGFGSVMTANVLRTCWWLGFLETILVCASQEKMLDMCVPARYIIFSGLKIDLVSFSIMNNHFHSLTESSGCKVGTTCYSRLQECFSVMLLIYFLEVLLAVLLLLVHHPRQGMSWINILANSCGVFLSMSSALSMTQVAIVGLLLGGSYGPLMTARGFWLCAFTGIVEMAALMAIMDCMGKVLKTRIDTGMSFSNTISSFFNTISSFFIFLLKMNGLFIIMALLDRTKLNGGSFFIADMSNCDETCEAQGKDLFAICELAVKAQVYLSLLSIDFILSYLEGIMHVENRQPVEATMHGENWQLVGATMHREDR